MYQSVDLSTIDLDKLKRYEIYNPARIQRYTPDSHMGSGCFLDAPGYPSYFLQSVWDSSGNNEIVIGIVDDKGDLRDLPVKRNREETLRELWRPLPVDHPRVELWIQHVYQYFVHCYGDPQLGDKQRNVSNTVSWPVSRFERPLRPKSTVQVFGYRDGKHGMFEAKLDPVEYRQMLRDYRTELKHLLQDRWRVASNPENHLAVLAIREFYPEHQPNLDYIKNPPKRSQEDWFERYATPPDPCPGHLGTSHGEAMRKYHYCRLCGKSS